MINVIVVIGSVTAKQYEPLRLEYVRRGEKVRIKRLPWADWDAVCYGDRYIDASHDEMINDFADRNDIGLAQVKEVIISEEDYTSEDFQGTGAAAFILFSEFWENLRCITVVDEHGNYTEDVVV